jgi:hypothetical protein
MTKDKDVKPIIATPQESEKGREGKKRKVKPSPSSSYNTNNNNSEETLEEIKREKSGKKKRKLSAQRAAHSDGEQDYVELENNKSKVLQMISHVM